MNRDNGQLKQRLEEVRNEEALLQKQIELQKYFANYIVTLGWPATITTTAGADASSPTSSTSTATRRTNADLVQHRLLEAGVYYEIPIRTEELADATYAFIQNMEASGCFHSVSVELGGVKDHPNNNGPQGKRELLVKLNEKGWLKLNAGTHLKDSFSNPSLHQQQQVLTNSFMPTAEFNLSAGLRNVAGCLDTTDLEYLIDTHNISTWRLHHKRPLYTLLPSGMMIGDALLQSAVGSQYLFSAEAVLNSLDHEWLSSFRMFQRKLSLMVETPRRPDNPWHASFEWIVGNYRDLVPRRHPSLPYQLVASKDIVALAGPSFKHSMVATIEYDNVLLRDTGSGLPLDGLQMRSRTEWALPPGDVGFLKTHIAGAVHWLLPGSSIAFHNCFTVGYLHPLSNSGLSRPEAILPVDRFILGGTGSLRGFAPGGIGPRSASIPHNRLGDALGSNFVYTATSMTSVAPPFDLFGFSSQIRMFGFATIGGCDLQSIPRAAAGVGLATQILGPRLEATYSFPLVYGPSDGKRRFQLGISLSIA
jgi:Omp85 superfamily domain